MNVVEVIKKADELVQLGNYVDALDLFMSVIKEFRRSKKKGVKVTNEILMAYNNAVVLMLSLADDKNKLIEAKNLALEMLRLTKKSRTHSDYYAAACFHTGLAFMALDDYESAVKYLEDALVVFELIGHEEGTMLSCKHLAEAYNALGMKAKAEQYANRAKAMAKVLGEESLRRHDWFLKNWRNAPWTVAR